MKQKKLQTVEPPEKAKAVTTVRFSNSSHSARTSPKSKIKRLPVDVQRKFWEANMWHTAADRAHSRWERNSGIDAIYPGEDSGINASEWAHEKNEKFVPSQPAPLPTVPAQVKQRQFRPPRPK